MLRAPAALLVACSASTACSSALPDEPARPTQTESDGFPAGWYRLEGSDVVRRLTRGGWTDLLVAEGAVLAEEHVAFVRVGAAWYAQGEAWCHVLEDQPRGSPLPLIGSFREGVLGVRLERAARGAGGGARALALTLSGACTGATTARTFVLLPVEPGEEPELAAALRTASRRAAPRGR